MLKNSSRAALRWLAKVAPRGMRQAFLEGLCDRNPERVFAYSARSLGYTAILASGDCGLIQGSCFDEVLLPTYSKRKTWAATALKLFEATFAGRGGTYIDVGANVGLTVLPVARNPDIRCVAFEPEPINFYHLSENVRRNSRNQNVEIHQLAVTDQVGTTKFALDSAANPGDHRIAAEGTSRAVIEVETTTLDFSFPNLQGTVGVKIDTQGAEPFVIAGGAHVLSTTRVLVLEFWPYGMDELKANPQWVYDVLREFGKIAILPGDVDGHLAFRNAADNVTELEVLYERARAAPLTFWDVYAIR